MDISPQTKVKHLSVGQRQMIEIGKALLHDAEIITFDEPTSSLSEKEKQQLFKIIRQLKKEQKVIIYVSHRMDEIFDLCDSCTILRDGRHVETLEDMTGIDADYLVQKMVGREITDQYGYEPRTVGKALFEVKDIQGPGVTAPVSFQIQAGEIVGFFGLVGAGRSELFKLIYGDVPRQGGQIFVNNVQVEIKNPRDAIQNRICFSRKSGGKRGITECAPLVRTSTSALGEQTKKAKFFIDKKRKPNGRRLVQPQDWNAHC